MLNINKKRFTTGFHRKSSAYPLILEKAIEKPLKKGKVFGNSWQEVRSGKNIFNNNTNYYQTQSGCSGEKIATGVRANVLIRSNFISAYCLLEFEKMLNKTYTLSAVITPSANNNGRIMLYWYDDDNNMISYINEILDSTGSITFTMPSTVPERSNTTSISILC